tara:strand:+ start:657 stop:989 length:333 start_codon:yes stop_codon:yes gene_type:complete
VENNMSELTDLEICKRIAEIEFNDLIDCYEHEFDGICIDKPMCGMVFREAYNPITDDALCFGLVKKYGVEIIPQWDRVSANNGIECAHEYAKNPNKAICLAIIGANKDKL